jgi:hypothetical protein
MLVTRGILTNVALVVALSLLAFGVVVKIDCPYCNGVGSIQIGGGQGSQQVKVVEMDMTIFEEASTWCHQINLYLITVNMTVSNAGNSSWSGWVEASFNETRSGDWNSSKYVWVSLGGASIKHFSFSILADITDARIRNFWDTPIFVTSAQLAKGVVKCPMCDGTRKIGVLNWMMDVVRGKESLPQPE